METPTSHVRRPFTLPILSWMVTLTSDSTMCGILFFDVTGSSVDDVEAIRVGADSLSHRGPDGSAIEIVTIGERSHLLAFHRLSIINPEGTEGMQPLHHEGGTLICNGEIYNHKDLALAQSIDPSALGSDVHVLLHMLLAATKPEDVRETLAKIDGEFALVMSDLDNRRVVAARDPWGVRPLFFATDVDGRIIAMASEAKALIGAPKVADVKVFPPGHVLVWEVDKEYVFSSYVPLPPSLATTLPPSQTVRKLVESAIIKRIKHSDRPVGVLCSGGLDSAIVTALVASDLDLRQRIRVFTLKYNSGHSEDAFYAQYLCSQAGLTLEVVEFGPSDVIAAIEPVIRACETCDPNTVRAAIPMYILSQYIAKHTDIKVLLSGEGADELFCGYSYMRKAPEIDGHAALNVESERLIRQLHMFDLLRADRCFGAFGLEVRVPYLDIALVEFVMGLQGSVKAITKEGNFVEKRVLRDAFRVGHGIATLLSRSRIIDRPKEKMSDGCGFSYVPQLLAHLGDGASQLDKREVKERAHYRSIFTRIYGHEGLSLVVPRLMPDWAGGKESVGALIGL